MSSCVFILTYNNLYNRDDDDGDDDDDGGLVEVIISCLLQSVVMAGKAGEFRQNGKKKSVSVVTG